MFGQKVLFCLETGGGGRRGAAGAGHAGVSPRPLLAGQPQPCGG